MKVFVLWIYLSSWIIDFTLGTQKCFWFNVSLNVKRYEPPPTLEFEENLVGMYVKVLPDTKKEDTNIMKFDFANSEGLFL